MIEILVQAVLFALAIFGGSVAGMLIMDRD